MSTRIIAVTSLVPNLAPTLVLERSIQPQVTRVAPKAASGLSLAHGTSVWTARAQTGTSLTLSPTTQQSKGAVAGISTAQPQQLTLIAVFIAVIGMGYLAYRRAPQKKHPIHTVHKKKHKKRS